MCLQVSIRKNDFDEIFIKSSELDNYRELNGSIPEDLFEKIKEWKEGKNTFTFKTSGSTGRPKTVEISRERIKASADKTIKFFKLNQDDTALIALGLNYIAGFMMLIRALESGMNIHFFKPNSDPFERLLPHCRYFAALVPLQVQAYFHKRHLIQNFKTLIIGGSAIHHDMLESIRSLSFPVYETYGMTETVSHIALKKINGTDKEEYFHVLENVALRQGNNRNLEIFADVCDNEWISTNDIVEFKNKERKEFKLIGRLDNVVNSGALKIHPELLEPKILDLNESLLKDRNFILCAKRDVKLGEKLILIIEGEELYDIQLESLKSSFQKLEKYHEPKEILFLKKFPRTESGKIQRSVIKDLFY